MKPTKHLLVTALISVALTAGGWAQTGTASTTQQKTGDSATQTSVSAADIQALKDGLATALKQIQALQEELHRRDQAVQQAQSTASEAAAKADAAQQQAKEQLQTVGELQTDVADLKSVSSSTGFTNPVLKNAVMTMQDSPQTSTEPPQIYNKDMEGPLTIHFRGINITPGGFAEAAFVRRSHALGADLTTPFNSLTMPGASQSQLSEFFGSARQSRPTVYVAGRAGNVDLSSYISGDFLSSGVTSTATQTNSYTFRLRQVWGQAKFANGWSFLGGQAWSLVTENKASIAPSDDLGKTNDSRPMTIDPGYNVGFTFARQYGIRLTKTFGNKVAIAFAMENPQATVTTHGNANNYILVQAGASNSYNTTSTYGFNPSPDLIAKIAFDPGFGHYEIFGLFDRFTDRIFPCQDIPSTTTCGTSTTPGPNPSGAFNASKNGGGLGANARWNFAHKHIVFGLHGFGGSGVGRYGAAQLSDVSINPDGSIHLIKDLQGLSTLEWHGKQLDIYTYGGAEYAGRTWGFDPVTGNEVGYGGPGYLVNPITGAPITSPTFNNSGCYSEVAPGTSTFVSGPVAGSLSHCTADTRAVIEGTLGFWYRFYSGPRGKFQFGAQYSYVTRNTWATVLGGSPNGLDGMVFTSFRYYLP